ncbi:hypothetical protein OROGR_009007 [Orobanche gracilis]
MYWTSLSRSKWGQMSYYENDFEAAMLKDTTTYYSRKASSWILDDLCPESDYMLKHVTAEGSALVKQAEDAASTNKGLGKSPVIPFFDIVISPMPAIQEFVRKVIELHDKFMAYVNDCFLYHTLFHKAFREAFQVICNKGEKAQFLLFDKSAKDEHEVSILTKLKQQCGGEWREWLVIDLTLARENQSRFEEYLSDTPNANPGINLTGF